MRKYRSSQIICVILKLFYMSYQNFLYKGMVTQMWSLYVTLCLDLHSTTVTHKSSAELHQSFFKTTVNSFLTAIKTP